MSFHTASAILRGAWLLQADYAEKHMPLVVKMIKGESVDFGLKKEESTEAMAITHAAGVYTVRYYTDLSKLPNDSIAVLDIIGPVTKYGDMCAYGSMDHATTLNRLGNAQNVSAIILNIDSPGGQASGTTALADTIKAVASKKPVVAVIDDGIAASAAMWIASAASEIYVTKSTDQVGSIGVYQTVADWYGYFEKEGLNVKDVYAPQSKDKNGTYKAAINGDEGPLKEDLAVLADSFINTIKANRKGKLTSDEWATGKMYYAKEAKKLGLIDGVKSFDAVVKRVRQMATEKQQQSNYYNMAFENTLTAAQAEAFEVVDGGFLLTEDNLNNIEAQLVQNQETIGTLTAQRDEQALAAQQTASELETANATIEARDTRITELEAEVATLKQGPAGQFTESAGAADEVGANPKNKYYTSYDAEMERIVKLKEN